MIEISGEYKEFDFFLKSLKLKKENLKKLEIWELEYILIRAKELHIKTPVEEIKSIILKQGLEEIKTKKELKKILEKKGKNSNKNIKQINIQGHIMNLKTYKSGEIYIKNKYGTYSKLKKKEFRKKHKLGYEELKKIFYNELGEI